MQAEITINGKTYVPKTIDGEIRIVICQRGFVFVGRVTQDGDQVTIRNAQNIRQWGTTRGLGEIAASGPTTNTKLDPAGTVSTHVLTVVATLSCSQSAWEATCM